MRAAVAEQGPPTERRLVKLLRREAWHSPDVVGDVVERPLAEAVVLVLMGYGEAAGWAPTKDELRHAAEEQFRLLDKAREERGLSVAAWLAAPGIRRQYDRIKQVLGG